MATTPAFTSTPRAAAVGISTANTNRDGTGTVATVFTAGASGSVVEKVRVIATGTTTAGVVRLFLNNGSAFFLLAEILVTAVTPSTTVAVFTSDWTPPGGSLYLPTGYSLRASTHNAENFNVVALGGDL